jgi:DhnA family fructose-bisphosphate aldolase class Ia
MDKFRRMSRIMREDGRSFIVAMDHGTNAGAVVGLERPGEALASVAAGGADAIIANMGFAKRYSRELACVGWVARLDLPPTALGEGHESRVAYDVEYAVKLGADAVIINGGPGAGVEESSLPAISDAVMWADEYGIPVIGEIVPGGFDSDPSYKTVENLALGVRLASELGVDMIKTPYLEGFEKIAEASYCPVVVLGGAKTGDTEKFFDSIKDAMDCGAAGVAIGRNVWGAEKPELMASALNAIIHEGADGKRAAKIFGGEARK